LKVFQPIGGVRATLSQFDGVEVGSGVNVGGDGVTGSDVGEVLSVQLLRNPNVSRSTRKR